MVGWIKKSSFFIQLLGVAQRCIMPLYVKYTVLIVVEGLEQGFVGVKCDHLFTKSPLFDIDFGVSGQFCRWSQWCYCPLLLQPTGSTTFRYHQAVSVAPNMLKKGRIWKRQFSDWLYYTDTWNKCYIVGKIDKFEHISLDKMTSPTVLLCNNYNYNSTLLYFHGHKIQRRSSVRMFCTPVALPLCICHLVEC